MYNSIWFIVERGSVQQQSPPPHAARSGRWRHRPKLELGAGGTCAPYRTVIVELKGCALVGGSEGDELIAGGCDLTTFVVMYRPLLLFMNLSHDGQSHACMYTLLCSPRKFPIVCSPRKFLRGRIYITPSRRSLRPHRPRTAVACGASPLLPPVRAYVFIAPTRHYDP